MAPNFVHSLVNRDMIPAMTLFFEIWAVCLACFALGFGFPTYMRWFVEVLRDPMA